MKIQTILSALLLQTLTLSASVANPLTALFMISSEGDAIGNGKSKSYFEEEDGHFVVQSESGPVQIHFDSSNGTPFWINFSAPKNQELEPGIYKNAEHFSQTASSLPGFSLASGDKRCTESKGEFEILEVITDHDGQVEAFAANFIQRCEVGAPPIFGTIRYNSTLPLEACFDEIFQIEPQSILYLARYNPETQTKEDSILITGEEGVFTLESLPYGGKGIEVLTYANGCGLWAFDFAAPSGEEFVKGSYENVSRYPFHSSTVPGIEIYTPEGGITQPQGSFKIDKVIYDEQGQIKSLALNFQVEEIGGTILRGSIRYNSRVAVDFSSPFSN